MGKARKALALLLCMVMCLTLLPTWALAEEASPAEEGAVAELQEENPLDSSISADAGAPTEIAVALEIGEEEPAMEEEDVPETETFEAEQAVEAVPDSEPVAEDPVEQKEESVPEPATELLDETITEQTEASDVDLELGMETPGETAVEQVQSVEQESPEEADAEEPEAEQTETVTVAFKTTPDDAIVTVYTKDSDGEKTIIDPEEDGGYCLCPENNKYYYNSTHEECISVEDECITFDAVNKDSIIEIEVELLPLEIGTNDSSDKIQQQIIKTELDNEEAVLQASGWNSWTTTGDLAQDLVNCAVAQKGKTGSELGFSGDWCAMFVSSCARKVGIPESVIANHTGAKFVDIIDSLGGSEVAAADVKAGDIVQFTSIGSNGAVYYNHVGIMTKAGSNNCVSGNMANNSGANTVQITTATAICQYMKWTAHYYRPNYNGSTPITVTITSKANATHSTDITDTVANISRYVYISGASFSNATDFGLELFDSSGSTKLAAKSDGKPIVSSAGYVDAWYKIGKGQEINYTLTPDTTYKYRFYTKIGGAAYYSDFRNITTTGFTVSYNANGGNGAPAAQKCATGANVTLSGTKPTRGNNSATGYTVTLNANGGTVSPASLTAARTTSYTFKNWNTAANGSGTAYNAGASYTGKASVTLYAQWNSSTTTSAVTLPVPTKTGHTFNGWATSSNAVSGIKGSYTPNGNVTLYATWTPDKYTVSYNANGGTGAPAAQTKTYGTALTISSVKPSRANSTGAGFTVLLNANGGTVTTTSLAAKQTITYSFKNWNTASDGSKTSYNPGSSYTANAATVLYAQWTSKTTTEAVELPTPSREGYSFGGWGTSSTATSGSFGKYTPSGNVTLYAVWTKNQATARFTDVSNPTEYFYDPVYWAVDRGITTGRTATTFDPYGFCTRGHIVTFLWRAMDQPEPTITNPFTDVSSSDSFYKAVLWAYEKGITTGQSATSFGPWNPCTRGQIVTFLWRAMGEPEPETTANPFTDVKPGDYFYKPVLWAVGRGITTGRTPTTFDPWATCTRGQAVTFIYRAMN